MALKTRNRVLCDLTVASMADIIFLLLIFFMLTSTLVSPNVLKLFLPSSTSKTFAKQTTSVSITKDIEYFVDKEKVSLEYLPLKLQDVLRGQELPTIVLNVEKSVAIEHVVNVMDIANKLKYKMVLATNPDFTPKREPSSETGSLAN